MPDLRVRAVVAEQLLVLGNFELAFRTIQMLHLNTAAIYESAAQRLCIRLRSSPEPVFSMLQQFKVRPAASTGTRTAALLSPPHYMQHSGANDGRAVWWGVVEDADGVVDQGTVSDDDWDKIVGACVDIFVEQHQDMRTAEQFVEKLQNQHSHVVGLVKVGKLKQAYLSAVKQNRPDQMQLIRDAAERSGATTIAQLCSKYLVKFGLT
eukprot:TRINITY_DN2852_c0_g1_i2.p1 TRINITY_DN2852_c0_g1~~TRINITY_DN2852_c0_g1_i2.p1  ORF type:complete len:208 (+),score=85.12 TRINITY_DN2852_c0_g1_i2:62-685(+)